MKELQFVCIFFLGLALTARTQFLPITGTATFSITYDFADNNTPENSQTIVLDRPGGNPNQRARLSYTMNYRIAPAVPGESSSDQLSFMVSTPTGKPLAVQMAPIPGTGPTEDVVAGEIVGSEVVPLVNYLVLSVHTTTNSNHHDGYYSPEGTFTGFLTYTMTIEEKGLWESFMTMLDSVVASVTGMCRELECLKLVSAYRNHQ